MKLVSRTVKLGRGPNAHQVVIVGAADYSGIGAKRIKELIQDGMITGGPDPDSGRGDIIIDRDSLDAYRAGQVGGLSIAAEVGPVKGN